MIMAVTPAFGPLTPAAEIAAAFPDAIQGKNIIVTGVSSGSLGLATAEAFASQSPANPIVTGRSVEKVHAAISHLKSKYPNVHYHALIMDLASQSSVRAAAARINNDDSILTIDILVNNAVVMAIPTLTLSEDGTETTFATNHLGHFLFTNLILPKMILAASQTLSTRSSSSAPTTRIVNAFSPTRSPRRQISCTRSIALNQRLGAEYGIASFAVHPVAVDTQINRHASPSEIQQALKRVAELGLDSTPKTPEQGANSSVLAAVDSILPPVDATKVEVRGVYIADCKVDDENVAAFAKNRGFADRLWNLSEELVKQKLEL
ncbi:NAD(P)-binding protein [Aspergillus crustosus]